jgi:hypothetical protein
VQLQKTTCARGGELILQKSEYPEIKASQCRLNVCHVINRIDHPGEKRREKQPASSLTSSWTLPLCKVCTRLFRLGERHTLQLHARHIIRRIVGGQAAITLVQHIDLSWLLVGRGALIGDLKGIQIDFSPRKEGWPRLIVTGTPGFAPIAPAQRAKALTCVERRAIDMVGRRKRTENERGLPGPELLAILALESTQGIDPWIGYPYQKEHLMEKSQAERASSLLGFG